MTTTIQVSRDKYHLQNTMAKWCTENIYENDPYTNWTYNEPTEWRGRQWCMTSAFGNTFFYFMNESDATAFALRWL